MKACSNIPGFTLTEVLVSMVLLMAVATAISTGVVQATNTLNEVRLKEMAFERLKSETDLLKAKIFKGESVSPDYCDVEYCMGDLGENGECKNSLQKSTYCYSVRPIDTGSQQARAYEIITQMKWNGMFEHKEKELNFYTAQMVW